MRKRTGEMYPCSLLRCFNFVKFLISVLFIFILVSCGLENYVYLYPVTNYTWAPTERSTVFTLNGSNKTVVGEYFREYVLYYKIYLSETDEGASSYSATDFDDINTTMYKDYYTNLYSYVYDDDVASTDIASIFEKYGFKVISFATPVTSSGSLSAAISEVNNPLINDNAGSTFTINFDIEGTGYQHPFLSQDDTSYFRLLRDTTSTANRDFLTDNISTDDDDVTGTGDYAYVMIYIVAQGVNDDMSSIYSSPTFLGTFELP